MFEEYSQNVRKFYGLKNGPYKNAVDAIINAVVKSSVYKKRIAESRGRAKLKYIRLGQDLQASTPEIIEEFNNVYNECVSTLRDVVDQSPTKGDATMFYEGFLHEANENVRRIDKLNEFLAIDLTTIKSPRQEALEAEKPASAKEAEPGEE